MEKQGRKLQIIDTTLRDGEQAAGIVFNADEKVRIALALEALGVSEIEAGIPCMGGNEAEAVSRIAALGLHAKVSGWNRSKISDIKASIAAGLKQVHISIPSSPRQIEVKFDNRYKKLKEQFRSSIRFAKDSGLTVTTGFEDSSQAEDDMIASLTGIAEEEGSSRIRYCDTIGILSPQTATEKVTKLRRITELAIEVHFHNDLGMATANTISALQSGADGFSGTILGIGERCGNAALEEVIMALRVQTGEINQSINLRKLRPLANLISNIIQQPVPVWKAVVGENAFAHESGIHTAGMLKSPGLYEAYSPQLLGTESKLVLGKHSGRTHLSEVLRKHNLHFNSRETQKKLEKLREASVKNGGSIEIERVLNRILKT